MTLPKLNTPTYSLDIPSTKEKKKYRPFLVKEEKNLLLALQESNGENIPLETIRSMISACFFDQVDINKLASFDVEYILLKLRSKSRGNLVPLKFKCSNEVAVEGSDTTKECGNLNLVTINLDDVEVHFDPDYTDVIVLEKDTGIGLKMKYPSFGVLENLTSEMNKKEKNVNKVYDLIADCVEHVFDKDKVFSDTEFTKAELVEWMSNLSSEQFKDIKTFFTKLPKLYLDIEVICQKCGHKETVRLEGLKSFLD